MNSRYKILLLIWLLQFVNYLDRVNISVAAPAMMSSLHLNAAQMGWVLSAFSAGYMIMQIPGGVLADRFGAKALLISAPLLFSFFTGLTGLATSLAALVLIRLFFGMGEGSGNAAIYKLIGENFTAREASKANSTWLTAFALAPLAAAPVVVWVLKQTTWHHVFFIFVLPGVLAAFLGYLTIPNKARHANPVAELSPSDSKQQWRQIVSQKSTWLLFFGYMSFNIAYWGFLGWVPTYLNVERHIDIKSLAYAASIPYLFGVFGLLASGVLGSGWLHKSRPVLLIIGGLGTAISLYFAVNAASVTGCVAGLCAAAFFLYGNLSPYASLLVQLAPEGARGKFAGFVSMGGQLGGVFAPVVVGYIVKLSGSFNGGFIFMMVALVVSAISFGSIQFIKTGNRGKALIHAAR